jgi:hypothetical protein
LEYFTNLNHKIDLLLAKSKAVSTSANVRTLFQQEVYKPRVMLALTRCWKLIENPVMQLHDNHADETKTLQELMTGADKQNEVRSNLKEPAYDDEQDTQYVRRMDVDS